MEKIFLSKKISQFHKKIRTFLTNKKFLEVSTPIMVPIPGMEPHLTPFETKLSLPGIFESHQRTITLYLHTSPELQMKKLLGEGFGNIFQITKTFRNMELGGNLHNPEFTMIEWYRKNANYFDIMKDCENLITHLTGKESLTYQKQKISLKKPWPRISVNELFVRNCGIDLNENKTFATFKKTATQKNLDINHCRDWDEIFFKIFLNYIEPNLPKDRPIFVYDYPASQAALAKILKKNPFFAERFELYIGGIEIANAFSELLDAKEQRKRLIYEQKVRKKLKKTVFDIDEEFLARLESISRPCAGIALGLDRLFMLLLDKKSIEEVILFPVTQMLNL